MKQTHIALFWISIDFMSGVNQLKEIISDVALIGDVIGTSSVYKKFINRRSEDLNSELSIVVKIETEKNQDEIFERIKEILKQRHLHRRENTENLVLLAFNQDVRLFPGENLPSPTLHTNPLILKCAAEAWCDYEHPVLKQTLNDLVRSNEPLSNVEFYAQGKILFETESF